MIKIVVKIVTTTKTREVKDTNENTVKDEDKFYGTTTSQSFGDH